MNINSAFEDRVLSNVSPRKKVADVNQSVENMSIEQLIEEGKSLRTDLLETSFKGLSIKSSVGQIELRSKKAFSLKDIGLIGDIIQKCNDSVQVLFSQDMVNFEPDEELIKKSANPLWIIRPISANKVILKRAW